MDGRIEHSILIEEKINKLVSECPKFMVEWATYLKANGNQPASRKNYIYKAIQFLRYLNNDISIVTPKDINNATIDSYFVSIQYKKLSNGKLEETSGSYRQGVWSCLDNLCEFLYNRGYIEKNYVKDIKKPKNRDLDRINSNRILLDEKDFNAILNEVNKDNHILKKRNLAIIMTLMMTGMRKTALTEINIEDFDFDNHKLTVIDKGDKRQEYPTNYLLEEAVSEWLDFRDDYVDGRECDTNALFISTKCTRIGSSTINDIVDKYCNKALDKHISPHKIRSGFCSIMYEKTKDIEEVRRMVGHSNVATTQRYVVTNNKERRRSMDIMSSILN